MTRESTWKLENVLAHVPGEQTMGNLAEMDLISTESVLLAKAKTYHMKKKTVPYSRFR